MHRPSSSCSRACCSPCSRDCMSRVVHASVWYSYLPSAETFPLCFDEGEGKHKRLCLLSHSLPPSPSHWSFSGLPGFFFFFLQQRCKIQASIFMHLEPFCVRSVRVRARSAGTSARPPQPSGKQVILQLHCKEFSAALTWWAKAGSWKLLTWISVSPCERTFFLLGARGTLGNVVLAVKPRTAASLFIYSA